MNVNPLIQQARTLGHPVLIEVTRNNISAGGNLLYRVHGHNERVDGLLQSGFDYHNEQNHFLVHFRSRNMLHNKHLFQIVGLLYQSKLPTNKRNAILTKFMAFLE